MDRTELVLEIARDVGFDLAGVAPLRAPRDASRFEGWLAAGRNAGMHWLERDAERILDPSLTLPGGRSILVVGLAHSRPAFGLPGGGRIARYAAGRDYHNVIGRRLRKLAERLRAERLAGRWRKVVDAGALLERSHAAEAGVGFLSKAANLLHPAFGPWFFLGELLLDDELAPTGGDAPAGSCGTCTACLDACPTEAIRSPGVVDAGRCLSYLTIEHRGPVPREHRAALSDWAFGCDVCSEVCPWGGAAPDLARRFGVHEALADGDLVSWVERPEESHEQLRGSPLRRAGPERLARNAALVLGNHPSEAGRRALLRALTFDPSQVVREASAWALGRGHGSEAGVRSALDAARSDGAPEVRAEAERALEG